MNRSKRAIEFVLVDKEELGLGRLESKGVRFSPAVPTTLESRESTMIEVYHWAWSEIDSACAIASSVKNSSMDVTK